MTTDQESEVWKPVPGINYEASNYGNLRHIKSKKPKKSYDNGRGYKSFVSYTTGIKIQYVHRCILMAFDYRDDTNKLDVNHKDFNRSNNKLSNLEWVSREDNLTYSREKGNYKQANKNHSEWMKKNSKLLSLGFGSFGTIAIQDTAIIEFRSQFECSRYFMVSPPTISARIRDGKELMGYKIYRA